MRRIPRVSTVDRNALLRLREAALSRTALPATNWIHEQVDQSLNRDSTV
jgi:hypothetical protein